MTKETRTATSEGKATLAGEPKGSLNLFPDLWMSPVEYKLWSVFHMKEDIKSERVEGFNEEQRLAYRLGVDEAIWFVAMPVLKSKPDDKLREVKARVEHQRNITTEIDGQGYMNALNWFIELLSDSDKAEATA